MERINQYIEKRALYPAWLPTPPDPGLTAIVVIPSYMEKGLLTSLESLQNCESFEGKVEVLVVLNNAENADESVKQFHREQFQALKAWWETQPDNSAIQFEFIYADQLPAKKAGVGLARKIGLDEGARRFASIDQNGLLICFDGDSIVAPNYLKEILTFFQQHPKSPAASISYAHQLEGLEPKTKEAIILYELHLRTYLEAKRWMGHDHAFETIGSAMVVRAEAYALQGGMNVRKAGEDFYFLNKFTPHSHFGEITATTVYPSARISKRVPFGTGRAMQDMLEGGKKWMTYSAKAYQIIRSFFDAIDSFYKEEKIVEPFLVSPLLQSYLNSIGFEAALQEIKSNTKDFDSFRKRLLRFFDAFQIMKCLHYLEAKGIEKVQVRETAAWLWQERTGEEVAGEREEELLLRFRGLH